MDLQSVLSNQ
jgi:hypothetical protein